MNANFAFAILIVFGIGCLIGIIPIVQNFPFPVGYDSINYYLPTLYDLKSNPFVGGTLFPVYVFLVYFIHLISFSDLYLTYNFVNIVLYGTLSVTTFLLVNNVFRQSFQKSLLFAIFVIFQLSVLRMAWDLHRDILAIIFLNLCLVALNQLRSLRINKTVLLQYVTVTVLYMATIFSDRMMGVLLFVSSIIFSIIYKLKLLGAINLLLLIMFLTYFFLIDDITFVSIGSNFGETLTNPIFNKNSLSPYDLVVLYLSLNGVLIPFFVVGFLKKSNSLILKIPTFVTILLSFSWLVIPNYSYLVPERWVILSGFFISIFGLYGFFIIMNKLTNLKLGKVISVLFVSTFVAYGIMFIVLPYGIVFTIPSVFQSQTGSTIPMSMSFNSLEITKNQDLVKSIDWINANTDKNSEIIGTLHWRGWFHLFLEKPRQHIFSEIVSFPTSYYTADKNGTAIYNTMKSNTDYNCIKLRDNTNINNTSRDERNVYLIDSKSSYNSTNHAYPIVYNSKYFNIYEITNSICV